MESLGKDKTNMKTNWLPNYCTENKESNFQNCIFELSLTSRFFANLYLRTRPGCTRRCRCARWSASWRCSPPSPPSSTLLPSQWKGPHNEWTCFAWYVSLYIYNRTQGQLRKCWLEIVFFLKMLLWKVMSAKASLRQWAILSFSQLWDLENSKMTKPR